MGARAERAATKVDASGELVADDHCVVCLPQVKRCGFLQEPLVERRVSILGVTERDNAQLHFTRQLEGLVHLPGFELLIVFSSV